MGAPISFNPPQPDFVLPYLYRTGSKRALTFAPALFTVEQLRFPARALTLITPDSSEEGGGQQSQNLWTQPCSKLVLGDLHAAKGHVFFPPLDRSYIHVLGGRQERIDLLLSYNY